MITKAEGKKILLVEDESRIRKLLFDFLSSKGFEVGLAADGTEGVKKFFTAEPDIVLLDVMMPGEDGFSVLAKIRECSFVPVIMITARVDIEDRIKGLNAGADDYVCKPFSFKELESRLLANLRYPQRGPAADTAGGSGRNGHEYSHGSGHGVGEDDLKIESGGLCLNTAFHSCTYGGQEVRLTAMQFNILRLLMEGAGRVFNRNQIGDTLSMNGAYEGFHRTIDAHIKNLRKALQATGCDGNIIETVRGVGYKFVVRT
ncbi:response regulator transcription factor [Candidatus Haliotispira prima]|uniref:Response regulator transcription factor n=1 Tax=Candidatus Haliotispira prima TaxID=3034016 RepID=A0ABY8MEC6_9SPIO|nr:response regulator transcription factor [Candidatus Haliotispira prima]